jgi:hypothetical protein
MVQKAGSRLMERCRLCIGPQSQVDRRRGARRRAEGRASEAQLHETVNMAANDPLYCRFRLSAATPRRWPLVCRVLHLGIPLGYAVFRAQILRLSPLASPLPQRKTAGSCPEPSLPAGLNPHSASLLPAASFLAGFQTPAGPPITRVHPSGRYLKPITGGDIWVSDRNFR